MAEKHFTTDRTYYLGLDMGTSSLGWAVTDEKYHLLRVKGKDLWGVRLFSEANTAAERRTHRTARRRLQRQKARIGFLKELFADEINKIDPGFYQRLDDSKYYIEDKTVHQKFALFADTGYTDKEYYQNYPTIYHLRKELLESDKSGKIYDVRLVYLAILNMFKHRGHFLNANLDDKSGGKLDDSIESFYKYCSFNNIVFEQKQTSEIEEILSNKDISKSARMEQLLELFHISKSKNKKEAEILKMICGMKGTISKIFDEQSFEEDFKKFSISFTDSTFDENILQVEENLDEEQYEFVLLLKQIHDWSVLSHIMAGEEYLSVARVKTYEKHQTDLKMLKKYFKENSMAEYNKMFREMNDNNYSAYVGSVKYKDKSERRGAKSNQEDFYKNIKNIIKTWDECETKDYIINEMDKGTFLPKQLTSENGVIPNQVHKKELKQILKNASQYLEFLNEKDSTGYTISEKIVKMFEFQIPYFVGPINFKVGESENSKHRHNMWSVRKEAGAVYPWNFEEKIDIKKSSEKFIENLVNHCTYLNDEKVLPKNSLLYEKFAVLNELNNLKINGIKMSVPLKQQIFNELFKTGKKVTGKKVIEFLKKEGIVDNDGNVEISGIDGDFNNKLSNYKKFLDIFEVDTLTYEQEQMAEKIIYYSTIYGDSRKFLKEKIEEEYGDSLSGKQLKRILGMKFKDWGKLSKELLMLEGAEKGANNETGTYKTIISRMWDENYNFMELVGNDNFTYAGDIQKKTKVIEKTLSTIEYEDLDELYISAPVRRMVWQTILVLKELEEALGCAPKKIFVEMTRDGKAAKERTQSRKNKFLDLYKACKNEDRDWKGELESKDEAEFRIKKVYLYYTQKGRCMYSGEQIDLDKLLTDNNEYDIDHIYPRHFVKDDSIENNLVLVKKQINAHKSDTYPLEEEIRSKRHIMWKILKDGNFITAEKYNRLMRNEPFSDEERANFINRQIVETGQGTKVIAELFKQTFPESKIVYVKAGNVSDFRHKFNLIKCRNVNDFHHANDAYLNIVVGNVYNTKFTDNAMNYIKNYKRDPKKYEYHLNKLFDYPVSRNGENAWVTNGGESINTVKKIMAKNTPLVTKMNYEAHGGIADQTIYSADEARKAKGVGYISVKSSDEKISDTLKYGGMKKFTGAYFILIEYLKKGKKVRSLEAMPLYLKKQLDTNEKIEKYFEKQYGYEEVKVRFNKIKMYSLIKVNGFYLYLTGRSENRLRVCNAVQLALGSNEVEYVRNITKANEKDLSSEKITEGNVISEQKNIELYDKLTDKHLNKLFSKRPNPVGEKLVTGKDKFIGLPLKGQISVLLEILKLSQLINTGANLKLIGESNATGTIKISKVISKNEEFKLINQSVTGLYENEIDLLIV